MRERVARLHEVKTEDWWTEIQGLHAAQQVAAARPIASLKKVFSDVLRTPAAEHRSGA